VRKRRFFCRLFFRRKEKSEEGRMGFPLCTNKLQQWAKRTISPQLIANQTGNLLAGAIQTGTPFPFRRAPECGAANPVRARTVAPRAGTCVITHKPFGNPPKAVSRFAGCIPASSNAGCGKGGSFVDFSFAGKKSRKRDEWAFHYVQTNFSSRRKELFPLSRSKSNEKPPTPHPRNQNPFHIIITTTPHL